jgi:hypothetical protein
VSVELPYLEAGLRHVPSAKQESGEQKEDRDVPQQGDGCLLAADVGPAEGSRAAARGIGGGRIKTYDEGVSVGARSDVRGLVYTAAYVPESGETINSLSVGYAPGRFLAHLVFAPSLPFVIVDPQFFPEDFAHDLNPKLGAEIAAQQRPTSLGLFGTPSGPAAWHALPSWYAVSAHDRAIDPALQRFMAERAGSTTVQFAAASHVGGLTHYSTRFVKLIEQAVEATAIPLRKQAAGGAHFVVRAARTRRSTQ